MGVDEEQGALLLARHRTANRRRTAEPQAHIALLIADEGEEAYR